MRKRHGEVGYHHVDFRLRLGSDVLGQMGKVSGILITDWMG